jgi:hypothetical protein
MRLVILISLGIVWEDNGGSKRLTWASAGVNYYKEVLIYEL